MASVVFLRGVNVGGHRTFRPSLLAAEMAHLGVVNVGAAGTFVVRKPITEKQLRLELRSRLPFETEVMICSGREILQLASAEGFAGEPSGPNIVRFVSVLPKQPRVQTALPLNLPPGEDWLVRLVAVRGRFAFGLYRRAMQTIGFLGRVEKHLGGTVTTRNWNTFERMFKILLNRK
jgi:uncharacterized protein (DUF1697 family)